MGWIYWKYEEVNFCHLNLQKFIYWEVNLWDKAQNLNILKLNYFNQINQKSLVKNSISNIL